jgi:hypothetical protein
MALSRFQFRLSTLLWITLAVACWFGGMRVERKIAAAREAREARRREDLWEEMYRTAKYGFVSGPIPDELAN